MKITGFAPIIVSQHADEIIKLFEDMGFERNHTKTGIEGGENTNFQLKNEAGFRVNVASSNHIPQDLTAISINVDDFDEAYDFLIAHGFVNPRGEDRVTDTGSSTATMLFSPSGFGINLVKHIK